MWTIKVNMELPFPFRLISKYARLYVFHRTRQVAQRHLWANLAASDFHIFPNLHKYKGGKKFLSYQEVKSVVNLYLIKLDKLFYHPGVEKLVRRYDKCLDLYGDYVKKWAQCTE